MTRKIVPLPEGLSVGKLVEHAKQPTRIIWILMVDMCSLFMGYTWFVGWVPMSFAPSGLRQSGLDPQKGGLAIFLFQP
jgi:hypothetical protein